MLVVRERAEETTPTRKMKAAIPRPIQKTGGMRRDNIESGAGIRRGGGRASGRAAWRWCVRTGADRLAAVRLLAFSDLHRDLGQGTKLVAMSAEADVVIGAGDFASIHEGL